MDDIQEAAPGLEARTALVERLVEVIGWPQSRIPGVERQIVGDVLYPLLRNADRRQRLRCAQSIARLVEPPRRLLRFLACDDIAIARPLLIESPALRDVEALAVVQNGAAAHWRVLAQRRDLTASVCDALVETQDRQTIEALLANSDAPLCNATIDSLTVLAEEFRALVPLLLERQELTASQGLSLFWWADHEGRERALRRFAVDRTVLLSELSDLFSRAAREAWSDPGVMRALGFLERRQRRRAQNDILPLEVKISTLPMGGLDEADVLSIAEVCGLTPITAERVLSDPGGEPIAVLAKAVGLDRPIAERLWRATGAPVSAAEDRSQPFGRMRYVYETLPTAKAQTVLRYWNWSLTADAIARGRMGLEASESGMFSRGL